MNQKTQKNAVAVVTGGAQGIGRAVAEALAARGDRVVTLDIKEAAPGEGILPIVCDVTDETQVEATFARIATDHGRVDYLVTSAGVVAVAPAMAFDAREFDRIMSVNVTGSYLPARVAARTMDAQGSGSIVLIGSVYGSGGAPQRTAYCASKGAVENMARSLAVEWGPLGIRVNVVAPTGTRTPMVQELIDRGVYDLEGVESRTPLGRLAEPEEVANAVAFLCSPEAQMINGVILPVDGGWIANGFVQKRKI
ncbi:SDR family NAD(P)-dependent oxidoreductase [Solirhodobacter olei]|uniref:SDR family NAD(P)-dependent oxidoreductase n=1 Tax=Solirhodobacter olei TaxID=2493082 RepID=UPI000FDB49CF|nr:SDR family oxidoreductase [Solirhodobacter olei]